MCVLRHFGLPIREVCNSRSNRRGKGFTLQEHSFRRILVRFFPPLDLVIKRLRFLSLGSEFQDA